MIHLTAWLTLPHGQTIRAGELAIGDFIPATDSFKGQFRYTPEYLAFDGAFPLDPLNLPLESRVFNAPGTEGVHRVFEDSLPDDWGRRLLARQYRLRSQRSAMLLPLVGANCMGAISYSTTGEPPAPAPVVSSEKLDAVFRAAEAFQRNDASLVPEEFLSLFQSGSSPGGGMPKATLEHGGALWLAKFPSIRDPFDVVGMECVGMELGRMAGLDVPEFFIKNSGGKNILFIRRFDVTGAGRNHVITFKSLLNRESSLNCNYHELALMIRACADNPATSLQSFFRQMVFNVYAGITDDHLKNFSMLHGEKGWSLTPAYDLVPFRRFKNFHELNINGKGAEIGKTDLLKEAKMFGLKKAVAAEIIEAVEAAVAAWPEFFEKYNISESGNDAFFGVNP